MPFKRYAIIAAVALVALVAGQVAARVAAARRAFEAARQDVLAADSLAAAADTTRVVSLASVVGDSVRVVERRAVQAQQRADSLDEALRRERVVRASLTAQVSRLTASVKSETVYVSGLDVRSAVFDVRKEPYTVHAEVSLPEPPAPGWMNVRVALDTIPVELRVGCGPPGALGVRSASLAVVTPSWASIRLDRVEQAPEVCGNGPRRPESVVRSVLRSIGGRVGLMVGYTAARSATGTVVAGPGVGIGFRVWP